MAITGNITKTCTGRDNPYTQPKKEHQRTLMGSEVVLKSNEGGEKNGKIKNDA